MYNVQSTDYGDSVTGNYQEGHLDCPVIRASQYLNPALGVWRQSKEKSGVSPPSCPLLSSLLPFPPLH